MRCSTFKSLILNNSMTYNIINLCNNLTYIIFNKWAGWGLNHWCKIPCRSPTIREILSSLSVKTLGWVRAIISSKVKWILSFLIGLTFPGKLIKNIQIFLFFCCFLSPNANWIQTLELNTMSQLFYHYKTNQIYYWRLFYETREHYNFLQFSEFGNYLQKIIKSSRIN